MRMTYEYVYEWHKEYDIRVHTSTTYDYIPVTYERAKITAVRFYLVTLVNGNKSMHTEAPPHPNTPSFLSFLKIFNIIDSTKNNGLKNNRSLVD